MKIKKKKQDLENFEPLPSGSNVKKNSASLLEINNFLSKYLNPLERKTAESIRWRIPVMTSEKNKENLDSRSISAACDKNINTKVVPNDVRISGQPKILSNVVIHMKAPEKQNEIIPIDTDTEQRDIDLNEELANYTTSQFENTTVVSGEKIIKKMGKKDEKKSKLKNVNTLKSFPLRPHSTKQFEETNFKKEIDLSNKKKKGIHPPLDIYAKRFKNNGKDQEHMRKAVDCFQIS
ncbi:uncharacterized protein LOC122505736 [Leptopilina heterotoma]|uniref:uncharacterized protein LOC122505736 n=1 Tax=Leptopilina heterotoma TaxID=63436 RepID=UPI001CA8D748|nr:uncharacterized protein LOC122505736 [Leptopilina heterotoma]